MKRVVILGRGAAGKTTLARHLGGIAGLPVIELDERFWTLGLDPMPRDRWAAVQADLVCGDTWILDGDLGPYDVLEVRLRAADTIIVLDFAFLCCAWRSIRRSREGPAFWRWLSSYRRRSRPIVMEAIANHAATAKVHVLRNPGAVRRFVMHAIRDRHACT
jgi:hypothetical protein